jgi:hypothetical protein
MGQFRHNHYVPISYQRRFMLPGQKKYYRLDLKPQTVTQRGHIYTRREVHHWGPDSIFAEDDLYTTQWGQISNTDIEQFFFGKFDDAGPAAIDFFANFTHDAKMLSEEKFQGFVRYLSVQKLRTPKGLAAFRATTQTGDKNETLMLLQQMQSIYCATWTDCVWQIAVYNRACPPLSSYCDGANDPDIRLNATQTYFPLSLDKLIIFTNLNWVRDPYQNEVRVKPNPKLFRETMFSWLSIQLGRKLTEDEVLQINLITKKRAYRYIAAADKEWLYPERRVSTDHWKYLGDGWLLMPEPRVIHMGGEIVIGFKGGGATSFSEYGHNPWEKGYNDEKRERRESKALERFKAEWAMKHGPKFTAYDNEFGGRLREDSERMTAERKTIYERYHPKKRSKG